MHHQSTLQMNHSTITHPLEQLSEDEICREAPIVREEKPDMQFVFNTITLKEPPYQLMLSFLGWPRSGAAANDVDHEALVVIVEKPSMKCYEGVVSLTKKKLNDWKYIPNVQPMLTLDDMFEVEALVLKDPRVIEECKLLGITDMSTVFNDPWAIARHVKYTGATDANLHVYSCLY